MYDRIAFGSFELDFGHRLLLRNGSPVHLGSRAIDLLCELVRVPGELVTKDDLIARVWPQTVVEENNLQVQISAIRKALAAQEQGRHWLQTVPGRGYRFVAAVRPVGAVSVEVATGPEAVTPALPDKPAIAVLPFANMSGDPEQQYFGDGVVEDIITALSRFSELFVIARNSSFAVGERAGDLQQVARQLGVRYLLTGSVRKADGRLRITAQLVDAATLRHLWADRFDGALQDVFALQDQVTERVVGALLPTVRRAEIERARRKPPASLDAYDYLLRALPLVIANAATPAAQAIPLLDQALRLNPDYAYAHALMSMAYAQIFRATTGPERNSLQIQGVAHARRAQSQPRHLGQVLARDKLGDAVDMTSDDMAAQFVTNLQCAFEIEPDAGRPGARRCHAQRFGCGIDRKERAAARFAGLDHRQADAGMRDRSADRDAGAGIATGDLQPAQAFRLRLDRDDLAHIGGDAREHF